MPTRQSLLNRVPGRGRGRPKGYQHPERCPVLDPLAFATRLREACAAAGGQRALARLLEVPVSTVHSWVRTTPRTMPPSTAAGFRGLWLVLYPALAFDWPIAEAIDFTMASPLPPWARVSWHPLPNDCPEIAPPAALVALAARLRRGEKVAPQVARAVPSWKRVRFASPEDGLAVARALGGRAVVFEEGAVVLHRARADHG